jgi:hypothetical protein
MKTVAYILLAVAFIVAVYWFFFRKKETTTTPAPATTASDAEKQAANFAAADLLSGGITGSYGANNQNLNKTQLPNATLATSYSGSISFLNLNP